MKLAFEIIGTFVVSLILIAIPILCTLSFAYNWLSGLKIILVLSCCAEWIGLMNLLSEIADKQDKK